ncbi:MAG: hypothetical protein AAF636_17770 [Pseudomonadota bacterium]
MHKENIESLLYTFHFEGNYKNKNLPQFSNIKSLILTLEEPTIDIDDLLINFHVVYDCQSKRPHAVISWHTERHHSINAYERNSGNRLKSTSKIGDEIFFDTSEAEIRKGIDLKRFGISIKDDNSIRLSPQYGTP